MKNTASPRQIAANRLNAQKSTGPATSVGRAVSRRNALKHGILSRDLLVCGLEWRESPREFAALHRCFSDALKPCGPVEEMLVDHIVAAQWRLRRALKAESGEIALGVDADPRDTLEQNPVMQFVLWKQSPAQSVIMRQSLLGLGCLQAALQQLRDAVQTEGELSDAALEAFTNYTGAQHNSLASRLTDLRAEWLQNPDHSNSSSRARYQRELLQPIDTELASVSALKAGRERSTIGNDISRQAAAVLPAPAVVDKIIRYETKLERQLYRAMNQLERLQRMRLGETIPAPPPNEISDHP